MTNLEKRCREAIAKWCKKKGIKPACPPLHIHPRAYVVGLAAPRCLIVAEPWVDSEPQCKRFNRDNPLRTVHIFDESLTDASWATTAYIDDGFCGQPIAIPVVE